jgi:hypothetical protein
MAVSTCNERWRSNISNRDYHANFQTRLKIRRMVRSFSGMLIVVRAYGPLRIVITDRRAVSVKRSNPQGIEDLHSVSAQSLDTMARTDVDEAIRQGLDDVSNGRTWPVHEVFDQIRKKYGVPR